jgi:hypothetical protein
METPRPGTRSERSGAPWAETTSTRSTATDGAPPERRGVVMPASPGPGGRNEPNEPDGAGPARAAGGQDPSGRAGQNGAERSAPPRRRREAGAGIHINQGAPT